MIDAYARVGIQDETQWLPRKVAAVRRQPEGSMVAFDGATPDAVGVHLTAPGHRADKLRIHAGLNEKRLHLRPAYHGAGESPGDLGGIPQMIIGQMGNKDEIHLVEIGHLDRAGGIFVEKRIDQHNLALRIRDFKCRHTQESNSRLHGWFRLSQSESGISW